MTLNISNSKILAIGAHPDDLEIGCFGTLSKLKKSNNEISILIMTKGEKKDLNGIRSEESIKSASMLGANIHIADFKDCYISYDHATISFIEEVINKIKPDLIFVHAEEDSHQDHRNTCLATISAARKKYNILCYESVTTLNFEQNIFVDITKEMELKLACLNCHKSQLKNAKIVETALTGSSLSYGFKLEKSGKNFEAFKLIRIII